jgi:two-component system, sensor histidine kinase
MFRVTDVAEGAPAPRPRRVLVVEDQPDGRETLRILLESQGHDVEEAGDGVAGVEKALSWRPDAAVVDIGLPLLNGWEVARQLRAALRETILLVALTGYNRPEDRARSEQAGFDVHLSKPAEPEALLQLLAR